MRSRYHIFFPLIAFILASVSGYAHDFGSTKAAASHKLWFKSNTADTQRDNYKPILNPNNPIPIISMQVHKTVQSVQAIFNSPDDHGICLKCYNFFSGSGNHQPVSSRKILLFPFHSFW